ncbi:MAG: hypothetical protein VKM97_01970 [Cyanobacteriota bacterium]|nr:hypothetical protein [Cyanobacteriota bacterium]
MTAQQPSPLPGAAADAASANDASTNAASANANVDHTNVDHTNAALPHDFDVQKQLHRQIRNDPDYDDWEYGTEPLPHEAWVTPKPSA